MSRGWATDRGAGAGRSLFRGWRLRPRGRARTGDARLHERAHASADELAVRRELPPADARAPPRDIAVARCLHPRSQCRPPACPGEPVAVKRSDAVRRARCRLEIDREVSLDEVINSRPRPRTRFAAGGSESARSTGVSVARRCSLSHELRGRCLLPPGPCPARFEACGRPRFLQLLHEPLAAGSHAPGVEYSGSCGGV